MPRDEVKFPGNTTEYYPDYIVGWLLITNPATSARIVQVSPLSLVQLRHYCALIGRELL